MESIVITPAELSALIKLGGVELVDCSKYDQTAVEHIPGSSFFSFSWDTEKLAKEIGGLAKDREIVAYDGKGLEEAARLWWVLKSIGFERVKILDGGLEKWVDEYGNIAEVEKVPKDQKAIEDLSMLSGLILNKDELLEMEADSFVVIHTDTLSQLREKLLYPTWGLRPIGELRSALSTLPIQGDKDLVIAGPLVGTLLLALHMLGKTDCKVLADGNQLTAKQPTMFFDTDEAIINRESYDEADLYDVPLDVSDSYHDTEPELGTRSTRFFTVLPNDSHTDTSTNPTIAANPQVDPKSQPSTHYSELRKYPVPSDKKKRKDDEPQKQCSGCLLI